MKSIIKSLVMVVAVAAIAGVATYSYFSSTTTSAGNAFNAGTMELQLGSDAQGYAPSGITFGSASNMAPGGPEVGPYNMYFKNTGSIPGVTKVNMTYQNVGDANTDLMASYMVVSNASFDTAPNRQAYWAKQIMNDLSKTEAAAISDGLIVRLGGSATVEPGDGPALKNLAPTVYGLSKITLYVTADGIHNLVWAPNDVHKESVSLMLDKSAPNAVQGWGVNIVVNSEMRQSSSLTSDILNW